ncbi:CIA30-domain-containing protein [Exidia glandulosa HHB12029]|uniref:CIA30-domain-containing protein n=1 Tax=Exidia glandulosa HHB12029 TaxID=1314781 RepID=A0A165EKY3_EXIGL|nr:CIA30-domain-containing protein [Exidia glandulosa HHB12029]
MSGADEPERARRTLFNFRTEEDLRQFVFGSDADIGGLSTAQMDLKGPGGTARFWGNLSLDVQPALRGKLLKSGYAGFRNRRRTTLFGDITEDLSFYDYIVLRVRGAGDPRTRHGIYVNMQTSDAFHDELWQHKLETLRNDGGWEDVYLPLDKFQLTTGGQPDMTQLKMDRRKVWMFGVSLLGKYGVEGAYELGIHSIDVEGDVRRDGIELEQRPEMHAHNQSVDLVEIDTPRSGSGSG